MEVNMESVRGEYIFLLDRSYSMEGDRIESAKKHSFFSSKVCPLIHTSMFIASEVHQRCFFLSQSNTSLTTSTKQLVKYKGMMLIREELKLKIH